MPNQRGYRLLLAGVVVLAALGLADASGLADAGGPPAVDAQNVPPEAPPREGVTVVTTDSTVWLADQGDGPRQSSELVAYAPDGDLLYHDGSHDRYWDVDPSPLGERTVLYTASDHLSGAECGATTVCTRNVIERVNLTTGEVTRLYARLTPHKHATRWHDVDRLSDDRFLVGDIYRDRAFVVDATTGIVEWAWSAQAAYAPESGGPFPRDWTHLNDVEVLPDGRYMLSLRNQDQVVFVDPETGIDPDWTLGDGEAHDVLHRQHNPDFVPADRGGPAVLVADSENNRVVEYQRVDGGWERSWQWADARLQWPRDADRLPNGNTLVTDSNGDRVFEVAPDGDVVWSVEVAFPYEAERLSTGDESAGGHSAAALGLTSRSVDDDGARTRGGLAGQAWVLLKGVLPGPLVNAVVYVVPGWFGVQATLASALLVGALAWWAVLEWRWAGYRLVASRPLHLRRERP